MAAMAKAPPAGLSKLTASATVVDVRSPAEYEAAHIDVSQVMREIAARERPTAAAAD